MSTGKSISQGLAKLQATYDDVPTTALTVGWRAKRDTNGFTFNDINIPL